VCSRMDRREPGHACTCNQLILEHMQSVNRMVEYVYSTIDPESRPESRGVRYFLDKVDSGLAKERTN
jgi:hypothetical protein